MTAPGAPRDHPPNADPPPPVLGNWARVYAVVLAWLGVLILVMYGFTLRYR